MLSHYYTVKEDGIHELEIKKSRFICALHRISTEEQAKSLLLQTKKEHWKANHHCSALILGNHGDIQRSSDDGEPSGTAGIPMLEVLKKNELINVLAIVTRYFGGTKLGAGGLIRAYSSSVSEALNAIGIVEGKLHQEITLQISYSSLGKVQNFLEQHEYTIKETLFAEDVSLQCMIDEALTEQFKTQVIDLLSGQVTFSEGPTSYFETSIH